MMLTCYLQETGVPERGKCDNKTLQNIETYFTIIKLSNDSFTYNNNLVNLYSKE